MASLRPGAAQQSHRKNSNPFGDRDNVNRRHQKESTSMDCLSAWHPLCICVGGEPLCVQTYPHYVLRDVAVIVVRCSRTAIAESA